MKRLQTHIETDTNVYYKAYDAYIKLIEELETKIDQSKIRNEQIIHRFAQKNRLLVRERIDKLIDKRTEFLELSTLAANDTKDGSFPSAGIITGFGIIQGKHAIIIANDATVKGGTYIAETIKKHLRAQEIAIQNNLPCVYLVDSGGIFLPDQSEVFGDRDHFGRFFYNQARMSAEGIPQIAVVMGSCTAGGAYVPAMSDETIMVKKQATVFVGGPPLVKAATGAEVDAETLGGAEMHTAISGTADYLAENDEEALQICRDIFKTIRQDKKQLLERVEPQKPHFSVEEIYGIAPIDFRKPFKVKELIARLVDGSEFHEFKPRYGKTLVTGFAHIDGYPVGIIANNGILFSESALKGTHFIELCTSRKIPLVFLQNVMGFMVGTKYEQGGIAKDGAKMVHAVANANVPKFTIMIGGSFGAGNYAMCGRAYGPNLLLTWPNARISVMGGKQAAEVLTIIKAEQLKRKGKELSAEEKKAIEDKIMTKYESEGSPYFATSRIWDDGIIDPIHTRKWLSRGIEVSLLKEYGEHRNGVFRM